MSVVARAICWNLLDARVFQVREIDRIMAEQRVSIRGTSDGLSITIGGGHWSGVLKTLATDLDNRASFFKGGRVSLAVGRRLLSEEHIRAVGDLLAQHQMTLWAVDGEAVETQLAAQKLGLEVKNLRSSVPPVVEELDTQNEDTLTVRRTIRSGQRIEHQGNVIILGDVNPGAVIRAGGYIIVWGKLRGTAQAGGLIPENAFVCALQLAPMQLVIGNVISRAPNDEEVDRVLPEMAFVQDGQIIAEAWR